MTRPQPCRRSPRRLALVSTTVVVALATLPLLSAVASPDTPSFDKAVSAADAAMTGPALTEIGSYERTEAIRGDQDQRLAYANYDLKINDHRVVGGEAVVVADETGQVRDINKPALQGLPSTVEASISAQHARYIAQQGVQNATTSTPELVVLAAEVPQPTAAYEVIVEGSIVRKGTTQPTYQHVFVDAHTGDVLARAEQASAMTEQGFYNGKVEISKTGAPYASTEVKGWDCRNQDNKVVDGPSTGQAMDLATGCVDVQYAVETQNTMYKQWFNRNGLDGRGETEGAEVGLQDANAYWTGKKAVFGHNIKKTKQMTDLETIGHEYGHGLLFTSGRGLFFDPGLKEGASDIMGTALEFFANNPNDPPDYFIGENLDFYGNGKHMRFMYQPSLDKRSTDCYEGKEQQDHYAAGPLNHWFFLLGAGTDSDKFPHSPTCNGSKLVGIGVELAVKIWYNGTMRRPGGTTTFAKMRTYTLGAARDLGAGSCELYDKTKAAWDAVDVKASADDPSCNGSTPPATTPAPSKPTITPTTAPTVVPTGKPTVTSTGKPTSKPSATTSPTRPRPTWTWPTWTPRPPSPRPTYQPAGTRPYNFPPRPAMPMLPPEAW